mmetsp:Transcript_15800/g.36401  ORF Transcript_15800/g.36401 Transcript_15800/m.36401 type:complete len:657 (+) Transcript_15800:52-2022(+)
MGDKNDTSGHNDASASVGRILDEEDEGEEQLSTVSLSDDFESDVRSPTSVAAELQPNLPAEQHQRPSSSAPAPPRWRFVAEAKKSAGYSSDAAGKYVRGLSSNELGAKYTAPDIPDVQLYRRSVDGVGPVKYTLPSKQQSNGLADVGKLMMSVVVEKDKEGQKDVGRLDINEDGLTVEMRPSGSAPKLPRPPKDTPFYRDPFKWFDSKYDVTPKGDRDTKWMGGTLIDKWRWNSDEKTGRTVRGVGRLRFKGTNLAEEEFIGEKTQVHKLQRETDGENAGREGVLLQGSSESESSIASGAVFLDMKSLDDERKKKARMACIVLILLLGIIAAMAALMGSGRQDEAEPTKVAAVIVPPPILITNTSVPSLSPSASNYAGLVSLYPSAKLTLRPSNAKETATPTSVPSLSPSSRPSSRPTSTPSPGPTPSPTARCSEGKDFDLCLAIDMSGSVCNGGNGSDCGECRADFLPLLFNSQCRDSGLSEDICCRNFERIQNFAKLIVGRLDEFDAKKSFSTVVFASTAKTVGSLGSTSQTIDVLNSLDYSGGTTNHRDAINRCRQTLNSGNPSRKKFILVVTDGVSTAPDGVDPESAAEEAAMQAQFLDDAFIIPVFISPFNDFDALSFMSRLSSDGQVFDVTDFESLASLEERLVEQVSCS